MNEKEYIEFLESLTRFVFDKSVFKRIANKRGLVSIPYEVACIDERVGDLCEMDLLEMVVKGSPNSIPSSSVQHGNFRQDIGSETLTSASIERAKERLREIYNKYGFTCKLENLQESGMCWVNENSLDV